VLLIRHEHLRLTSRGQVWKDHRYQSSSGREGVEELPVYVNEGYPPSPDGKEWKHVKGCPVLLEREHEDEGPFPVGSKVRQHSAAVLTLAQFSHGTSKLKIVQVAGHEKGPPSRAFLCGAYRDRTGDLRLAKPALSQLS
jgi:hypothetical protein